MWEINAEIVLTVYSGYVDWDEEFYICPDCGEPVYKCDWNENELQNEICPICGFCEEEEEEV